MQYLKRTNATMFHTIVMPIISSLIVPIVILDICIEIYHHLCFPLCNIPLVQRHLYIQIDRHKLNYLSNPQKLYCIYCGYVNGVLQYWTKIAAETETYWCGIRHQQNTNIIVPAHHKQFATYNDEEDFRKKYHRGQ